MENPFFLHPQQLQRLWKDLRGSINSNMPTAQQLHTVVDFWRLAPISQPYLDYVDSSTWPDPWSLIDSKLIDPNVVALGMFYTLLLSEDQSWRSDRLKLAMIRNRTDCWERLICVVDQRWLLNYNYNRIVDGREETADLHCMHIYKYDLHKRNIVEILADEQALYHV